MKRPLFMAAACLCVSCGLEMGSQGVKYHSDQSTRDTTLAGVDQDRNGVRDDVDILLKERYQDFADPQFFAVAEELAQIFQKVATEENWTQSRATKLAGQINKVQSCLIYRTTDRTAPNGDFGLPAHRLAGATFNTAARLSQMDRLGQLASGTAFTAPSESECGL